jgi:hypothetical protein
MSMLGHVLRFGGVAVLILANLPPPYGIFVKHRFAVTLAALLSSVVGMYMNGEVINFVK